MEGVDLRVCDGLVLESTRRHPGFWSVYENIFSYSSQMQHPPEIGKYKEIWDRTKQPLPAQPLFFLESEFVLP